jgi:hypothetical protein
LALPTAKQLVKDTHLQFLSTHIDRQQRGTGAGLIMPKRIEQFRT